MTSTGGSTLTRGLLASLTALALLLPPAALLAPAAADGYDPCAPGGNPIVCENSRPGTDPYTWDIAGAGDSSIQGFASSMSVDVGETVDFKIDTPASAYSIDVYRTGWYGGLGARHVASVQPSVALPQTQPQCLADVSTELYDCGNWAVSASWTVPQDTVSGVFVAHLRRLDGPGESHITFVVRDDASTSDVVLQTSDTTWQAYNPYGGASLYQGAVNGRAYKISYNRPVATRSVEQGRDFYFSAEYPMVRFLERNGYDVSYVSGVDTHARGHLLTNHKVFVSVGHDEYWSYDQRRNVEAARDAGVHLAFFSGNEVYWEHRWEDSTLGTQTGNRTLVTYKETWDHGKTDPSQQWTGTWRDPRFAAPADGGGLPENALTGTAYVANFSDMPITVSADEGRYRLWRNTPLASLPEGASAQLAPHTVGYESNEDLDNGFRPAGLIRLSTTTGATPQYLQDFGTQVAPGVTTHHLTLYRATSGALVFSAGTVQWAWGLDDHHDGQVEPADPRMQQATINLFADMDAQPGSLQAGLQPAAPSSDVSGPDVVVATPSAGATVANGTQVTATGTASDAHGVVAGVEYSTDGGTSWRPASGTTQWSFTYVQPGQGAHDLRVRAVDDSANIGAPATVGLTVDCPCSVYGQSVPEVPSAIDDGAVELGLRFTPALDGYVSALRFYKGATNTGTHTGRLWSSTGGLLADVTFTDEQATGWQTATLGSPVPVQAGTTYVVSYGAPQGGYAVQAGAYWYRGLDTGPLAVDGGFGTEPAGVYGTLGTFPSQSYARSHYFVDVELSTVADLPLTVSSASPVGGASSVPVGAVVSAVFSKPVVVGSVAVSVSPQGGSAVAGGVSYEAGSRSVTFTPDVPLAAGTSYVVVVTAQDEQGRSVSEGGSWSFTTAQPDGVAGVCPCSVFTDSTAPGVLEVADDAAVTLGMRFAADVDGFVTGVRFYKGPGNTGSHTGALWSASGGLLASGTFSGESAQGWQTLVFDQPVAVGKDTDYVVSYRTGVGRYSARVGALAQPVVRGPLRTAANGGSFSYADAFPGASSSTSYLVDVVFERAPEQLAVTSRTPAVNGVAVSTGVVVSATFSKALVAGYAIGLDGPDGAVAGTGALSGDGRTLSFTPASPLRTSTAYTVTITGARDADGTTTGPLTWTFETACPCALFSGQVPQTASSADSSVIELGVSFRPSVDGLVSGMRFYKGEANTGTHTGTLWSATGQALAGATFTDESATGWQTAAFDSPVPVQAGTTYVVSYLAPQGGYAATRDYFTSDRVAGPLTAPAAGNGRYRYGGGFPTSTYQATNYYVDVLFVHDPTPPTVVATAPPAAALDVSLSSSVSATLSKKPAGGTPALTLTGPSGPVPGTSAYDATAKQVVFTPDGLLPASTTLAAEVTLGGAVLVDGSWSFGTAAAAAPEGTCPCTLWTDASAPVHAAWDDPTPVQVGVRFTTGIDGVVTGVRFYKGLANTGAHTVNLWDPDGTLLASQVSTGESAAGWQAVVFDEPVAVTAGLTYTASYHSTTGRYAVTSGGLSAAIARGPLSTTATGGAYVYGTGFPVSGSTTNFWVDPVFSD